MTSRQDLLKKWAPILEHDSLNPIKDNYRKEVTAVLLENTERELAKSAQALFEDAPSNSGGAGLALGGAGAMTGGVAGYDPVLISLVRRAAPQLIAYDICGVQPMTGPTGLIFAMRSRYGTQSGDEAFYNEANTRHAGAESSAATTFSIDADTSATDNVFANTIVAGPAMPSGSRPFPRCQPVRARSVAGPKSPSPDSPSLICIAATSGPRLPRRNT